MKLLLSDSRGALNVVLLLPVLAALLTLAALWFAIGQWRRGEGNGWMRFRHLGAVVLTTAVLWSFHHWNLLGWHY